MIFGYGDEMDKHYEELADFNDNEYLNNVKSIRYLEASNYHRLLEFVESAPYQIYIMGLFQLGCFVERRFKRIRMEARRLVRML